eukprot:RCo036010
MGPFADSGLRLAGPDCGLAGEGFWEDVVAVAAQAALYSGPSGEGLGGAEWGRIVFFAACPAAGAAPEEFSSIHLAHALSCLRHCELKEHPSVIRARLWGSLRRSGLGLGRRSSPSGGRCPNS